MTNNINIKNLGVFGPNLGLEKMREAAEKENTKIVDTPETSILPDNKDISTKRYNSIDFKNYKRDIIKKTSKKNIKGAGAPVRQFDRIYSAKQPLKLSALLNSTSRNLVEKYETELSRDELLRKALDEYIKQHLSLEDRKELYNAVLKDLDIFREKYPTVPERNSEKKIIRTIKDIEDETATDIRNRWGVK